ncbi:tape measure protein [Azospirillum doebereinerae]|nr:tape measure protein [Azospirillum doebereinerae]
MANPQVSVVVSAVDRLTAPIAKMNAAMTRLTAPIRAVNAAMGNLSNVSGVTALGARFQALGGSVKAVSGHVGALVGKVAGLAGIGSIGLGAGAVAMGKSVVSVSAQFEKFETILTTIEGSNAKAKESMKWVADFAAKTPYELDGVMDSFVKLKSYGIDPTGGALQTLGDASAAMGKPLNQAVEALADGITGEMERLKEFGIKSSTKGDIVSMAFTDAKGRQRTFQAAKGDAKAMQAAILAIFKAKGFDGAMDNLSKTWDGMTSNLMDNIAGFWRSIGAAGSFDVLKGKLAGLLAWIDRLKADGTLDAWAKRISDAFVVALGAVETKIKAVDWEDVWQRLTAAISDAVDWVQRAIDYVGGWENAAMIVVAVMNGSLIGAVLNLGLALGGAALGFVRLGFSMAALAFGPLITAVGSFFTALRAGRGVVAAFNVALSANPIGMLIMSLAALGTAVYFLYDNWDTVGPYFTAAWDTIKSLFSGAIDAVLSVLSTLFTPHLIVARAVNDMIASITGVDLFALGSGWIDRFWEGLKGTWAALTAWLPSAWEGAKALFSAGVDGVLSLLSTVFTPHLIVMDAVNAMVLQLTGVDLFATGSDWVNRFWDGLKGKWAELTAWLSGAMTKLTDWMPDWAKEQMGLTVPKGDLNAAAGKPPAATPPKPTSAVSAVASAPGKAAAATPATAKPALPPATAAAV